MTSTTLHLSKSGGTAAYRTQGTGAPLVLIHGVGMRSAAWGPQMEKFAADYQVIALDLPGHGGSSPLPIGSQLPDYVAWCRSVIETLDLGPVNLVGHSMGALIAGGLSATHPELVQRVALLNGVFLRDKAARSAVLSRAADISAGKIDFEAPLARWFEEHQHKARAQVASWLEVVDPVGYATAYTAFAGGDAIYADAFSQISCPFLAITGDGDPNSTPEMSNAMANAVQNGRAITIKGHRHMVNLTAIDDVNAHLSSWVKQPLKTKDMQ